MVLHGSDKAATYVADGLLQLLSRLEWLWITAHACLSVLTACLVQCKDEGSGAGYEQLEHSSSKSLLHLQTSMRTSLLFKRQSCRTIACIFARNDNSFNCDAQVGFHVYSCQHLRADSQQ